jgi:hypothetical protein
MPSIDYGGSYTVTAVSSDTATNTSTAATTTFKVDYDPATTVFVKPGGAGTGDGLTPQNAASSIQAGITAAVGSGRSVVAIAGGAHGGFSVVGSTRNNLSFYGGFNGTTWKRSAVGTDAVAVSQAGTGVLVDGATGITIQQMTITGTTAGTPGASTYGLRAVNSSTVALNSVNVVAQAGASGADGNDAVGTGTAGAPGGNGGTGGDQSPGAVGAAGTGSGSGGAGGAGGQGGAQSANGGNGQTGGSAAGGGAGGSGSAGASFNSGGGTHGNQGTAGATGTNGAGGSLGTGLYGASFTPGNGTNGGTGGNGTGGGGGGGAGEGCQSGICAGNRPGGGGGGGGGQGGTGGAGGDAGGGGGGSFAIYTYNSTVTVDASSTLTAGDGGDGGDGKAGQAGGAGGAGGRGGDGTCVNCGSGVNPGDGGAGGNPGNGADGTASSGGFFTGGSGGGAGGGSGGAGGSGGGGGGGAGGPSIGTLSAGTGGVTVPNPATQITIGSAGAPGSGAGAAGDGGSGTSAYQLNTSGGDTTAPTVTSMVMQDNDNDGRVDRVVLTFSENLASYSAGNAPWTLANVPSGGSIASVAVSTNTATITLNEGAGAKDTAVGSFTVALAANAGGIRDAAGNLVSFSATAPSDGAKPVPVNLTLSNGGTSGRADSGDAVNITFSEALGVNSICSAWSGDGSNQPTSGSTSANASMSSGDVLTFATCNVGSVALNANYNSHGSQTRTYNANATWTVGTKVLRIAFTNNGSSGTQASGVAASTPSYTPSTSIKDAAGNAMNATAFPAPATSGF